MNPGSLISFIYKTIMWFHSLSMQNWINTQNVLDAFIRWNGLAVGSMADKYFVCGFVFKFIELDLFNAQSSSEHDQTKYQNEFFEKLLSKWLFRKIKFSNVIYNAYVYCVLCTWTTVTTFGQIFQLETILKNSENLNAWFVFRFKLWHWYSTNFNSFRKKTANSLCVFIPFANQCDVMIKYCHFCHIVASTTTSSIHTY